MNVLHQNYFLKRTVATLPFYYCKTFDCFAWNWCSELSYMADLRGQMLVKSTAGLVGSVQFSRSVVSDSLRTRESQHARPPCPSPTPGVHSDSSPSSQWCHPTISSFGVPSPPVRNPSQHQGLFQWVNSSHEVAKVLEFQLQHHSLQRNPRADLLQNGLVGSSCRPRDSQESSPPPQFESINSLVLSFLYSPNLTSIHDYWKNHSFDYTDLC